MDTPHVEIIEVQRGRRIALHHLADGDRVVVLCHPAPGAGNFDPDPEQTRARGISLLALDRPGYGQSDPLALDAWPSVAGAADDLASALERGEYAPVGVAGWSAGGRVALALAARHPDLVDRVAVIGTPAPNEAVPWVPPELQAALEQLRGMEPAAVRAALEAVFASQIPSGDDDADLLGLLGTSPADEPALAKDGARERLARMLQAAFAQGAGGLAGDITSYSLQSWGFEPGAVRAKSLLLYGAADPIAGPRHGRWWQQQMPDARLETVPGAGHLLLLPMWGRVLRHLAPRSRRKPGGGT